MGWELSGVAERREGNCQGWTKDGRQIVQGSKKTEVELSGVAKKMGGELFVIPPNMMCFLQGHTGSLNNNRNKVFLLIYL